MLQSSEEDCRKYREWLGGMVDAANAVVSARQQQVEAEQNVKESQEALALYVKVGALRCCATLSWRKLGPGMLLVNHPGLALSLVYVSIQLFTSGHQPSAVGTAQLLCLCAWPYPGGGQPLPQVSMDNVRVYAAVRAGG